MAKCGQVAAAKRQLEAFRDVIQDDMPSALASEFALVETHVRVYADEALGPGQARRLLAVLETLPDEDAIGQALANNHLSMVALHRGEEALRRRYLELLAHSHSNKKIGRSMDISANTVKYHLKQTFRELRVDNRSHAVRRARELGIVE